MANPQTLKDGIRGKVHTANVVIHTLPQALELLRDCLTQLTQAAFIVLRMNGMPTAADAVRTLLRPVNTPTTLKGRAFSAAAKARMSAGMKVYWQQKRAAAAKRKAIATKASMAALRAKRARTLEVKKVAKSPGKKATPPGPHVSRPKTATELAADRAETGQA